MIHPAPIARLTLLLLLTLGEAGGQQGIAKLEDPLKGTFRTTETTRADQTALSITVYNNNLALVRDRRKVSLFPGEIFLTFADVAQQIQPETVSLASISDPGKLRIIEQNYEYDLMSPQKLMEKYVGKKIRLINFSNDIGFTEVEAELLSVNQGNVYRIGDEIFLGHPGSVVLPEIPENLIAKPSLVWLLDNSGTDQEIEATYLTRGVTWKADYVLKLNRAADTLDMDAWVTLANTSGVAYPDARLKLVAGEPHRVSEQITLGRRMRTMKSMAEGMGMEEEAFAEYHLYTLPRLTTIKENQSKQVSLFNTQGVSVEKVYEFRGNASYFMQKMRGEVTQPVTAFLTFWNREANELGVPLPGGIMRIYQEDREGMFQFAGEDRIRHTPKDEKIRLNLGKAFDIVGERVQREFTRIANNVIEAAFEITLRNHKAQDVEVRVIEPMSSDWTILQSSHTPERKDAFTVTFGLHVPSDGETVLTYRVRVRQ